MNNAILLLVILILLYYTWNDMPVIVALVLVAVSWYIKNKNKKEAISGGFKGNNPSYPKKDIISKIDRTNLTDEEYNDIVASLEVFRGKKFNRCWVVKYLPHWNSVLRREFAVFRDRNVRFLQIGVFEGLSLMYLNSMLPKGASITVIDDFSTEKYFGTEETFRSNTADLNIHEVMKEDSHTALSKLISRGEKFDFIYCSGSRKPYVCYVDFALLSKVVNDDSLLLLDEYSAWSSYEGDISPDKVRDVFIESFKRQVDVVSVGLQKLVKFKKIALDDWVAREKPADCVEI